jgi:hypothetical protein
MAGNPSGEIPFSIIEPFKVPKIGILQNEFLYLTEKKEGAM